jgi:hypothetical protein
MDKWKYKDIHVSNEKVPLKIGVAPIDEKMRENPSRWFGHVQRRAIHW